MSNDQTAAPLIPTMIRLRLPRGFSHPVGAEIISGALAGCPQFDQLWTSFGSRQETLWQAPAKFADYRLAFTVRFDSYGAWSLSVSAVPSNVRAVVRKLLIAIGLPQVREWLCRARPETWFEGYRKLQVGYALEPLRICFLESQNRRVVEASFNMVEDLIT